MLDQAVSNELPTDDGNWYVLRSKSGKEPQLAGHAMDRGFTIYYPKLTVNPVNPRSRKTQPYFPGYMFVHADIKLVGMTAFTWMPYSLGLVSFGGEAARVPDAVIHGLRRQIEAINETHKDEFKGLRPGDAVEVLHGPLRGYKGIFEAGLSGRDRVKVLLTVLHENFVSVEMSVSDLVRDAQLPEPVRI